MTQRRITLGHLACLGLVALGLFAWVGLVGAATASRVPANDRPRFAAFREKFKEELRAMDRYRRDPEGLRDGSGMPAAFKFFKEADLQGLHQETIEALLGPPQPPRNGYLYGNGEIAVIREIIYDDAHRVSEVKVWWSE